jgi:Caspase domain
MTRRRSPALVLATRSGGTTIDRDAFGGNPFATALIQVAGEHSIPFRRFPGRLRTLTVQGSQRHQVPQWTRWPQGLRWSFRLEPGSRQERRCTLVLIVSDYTCAGLAPLGGAAHDERRISAMFSANGFSVVQGVAPDRASLIEALAGFRLASGHDVAIIYATGHGIESNNGSVYLMPGDYPLKDGCSPARLRANAVPVAHIAAVCRASQLNLVFFAGCRTPASKIGAILVSGGDNGVSPPERDRSRCAGPRGVARVPMDGAIFRASRLNVE